MTYSKYEKKEEHKISTEIKFTHNQTKQEQYQTYNDGCIFRENQHNGTIEITNDCITLISKDIKKNIWVDNLIDVELYKNLIRIEFVKTKLTGHAPIENQFLEIKNYRTTKEEIFEAIKKLCQKTYYRNRHKNQKNEQKLR